MRYVWKKFWLFLTLLVFATFGHRSICLRWNPGRPTDRPLHRPRTQGGFSIICQSAGPQKRLLACSFYKSCTVLWNLYFLEIYIFYKNVSRKLKFSYESWFCIWNLYFHRKFQFVLENFRKRTRGFSIIGVRGLARTAYFVPGCVRERGFVTGRNSLLFVLFVR